MSLFPLISGNNHNGPFSGVFGSHPSRTHDDALSPTIRFSPCFSVVRQWTVGPDPARQSPDRLVFDLDPGEGATVVECARVAERLLEVLTADGLIPLPKTSSSKGLQIYCGVRTHQPDRTSAYAKAVAEQLAKELPELVVAKMAKNLHPNRVLIDWSQNHPAKTTVAPYSLRGRAFPTVSAAIRWAEVRACRTPAELTVTADDVLHRVGEHGDLLAESADTHVALPGKRAFWSPRRALRLSQRAWFDICLARGSTTPP
ncbi:hypothetical protein [Amycolatopsis sp. NPDC051903]|uniref:non-homologous end-joining DNA ligase LigD n=1 Tax=Amycolatopsis sp. NPDC051903 TaxID=3363936 RepID=UPI0037B1A998